MAVRVPSPPAVLRGEPLTGTWPAGVELWRVHSSSVDGRHFASSGRSARFSPFLDEDGEVVPWLYAAANPRAAFSETIFHDLAARPGQVVLPARYETRILSRVVPRRDLHLVQLTTPGLRRLGLRRTSLIETHQRWYPRSAAWTAKLHSACPDADGLLWMSRLHDSTPSVMLFGDRVDATDLDLDPYAAFPLAAGRGLALLQEAAEEHAIMIVAPSPP